MYGLGLPRLLRMLRVVQGSLGFLCMCFQGSFAVISFPCVCVCAARMCVCVFFFFFWGGGGEGGGFSVSGLGFRIEGLES